MNTDTKTGEFADLIIVGGGPGGRTVANMVRAARPEWRVLVVKEEAVNPSRCLIPYLYDDTVPLEKGMIPNTQITDSGAELLISRASGLDAKEHLIQVDGQRYGYGRLVVATGAAPVVPPVPGADLPGTYQVRNREDVVALRDAISGARRAAVIGMGLVGAEVAASLRRTGLEVTGIDMLPHVLGGLLDDEYATTAENKLLQQGIKLLLETRVERITGSDRVEAVVAGGQEIPVDLVVWAVGVKPQVELARDAGAEVASGGIVVDDRQRTSLPDVYAIGDCVETNSLLTGKPQAAKLGTTAVFQGRVVANQILGKDAKYPGTLASWACQLGDLPLGGVGLNPHTLETSGFDVITADAKTMSLYPQMPGTQPVYARLYFERGSLRVLGAQLRGTAALAGYLDLLALAIAKGLTAHDLAGLQYATHPELAPKPSDSLIVMVALAALKAV